MRNAAAAVATEEEEDDDETTTHFSVEYIFSSTKFGRHQITCADITFTQSQLNESPMMGDDTPKTDKFLL